MPAGNAPKMPESETRSFMRWFFAALTALAVVLILWRGPAILLDLSALAAYCF